MSKQELIDAVLALPEVEREEFVDLLNDSLHPDDPDVDAEWLKVAMRRSEEIRSGAVIGIPSEEVFAAIEQKYKK